MNNKAKGKVDGVLEDLLLKVDRLTREKSEEIEESRRALASVGKLAEAIKNLEYQKKREKLIAAKVAEAYSRLENMSGEKGGAVKSRNATEVVNGILNGAKTIGQVIQIIAGSLQVMMESVAAVVKNQSQSGGTRGGGQAEGTRSVDLVELIKPISTLLNSLASKSKATPAPQADGSPEAEAGLPIKMEEKPEKKPEHNEIPVVKAVSAPADPAGEENDRKKGGK